MHSFFSFVSYSNASFVVNSIRFSRNLVLKKLIFYPTAHLASISDIWSQNSKAVNLFLLSPQSHHLTSNFYFLKSHKKWRIQQIIFFEINSFVFSYQKRSKGHHSFREKTHLGAAPSVNFSINWSRFLFIPRISSTKHQRFQHLCC